MPVFNLTGKLIGGYVLHEEIGHGGMAAVYRAMQPSVKREVAIKLVQIQPTQVSDEFKNRFEQEAELIAGMEHIHILPIYDYGVDKDMAYIAMRYLRGGTLRELINGRPLPLNRSAELLTQVARALAYAHRRGVIHRDVKPSNILLDDVGNAFLSDFGLAKWMDRSSDFTNPDSVVGTLAYISPEQVMGVRADSRSDVYSLGIVLYDMLTGHSPFETSTTSAAAILHHHLHSAPTLPSEHNPLIIPEVDAIVLKALEKKPEKRFATADKLADAFNEAIGQPTGMVSITPSSSEKRRYRRQQIPMVALALGLIVVTAAVVAGMVAGRGGTSSPAHVLRGQKGSPADLTPSSDDVAAARARLGRNGFIGYVTCNQTSEYHATQVREVTEFARQNGLPIRVYDSDNQAYKQLTLLENARTDGATAVIICLLDAAGMDQALTSLQDGHVPVVFFNPGPKLYGGVGLAQDEFTVGRAAGRFAGQIIRDELGGQARMVILDYPDLPNLVERANGLEAGVLEFAPDAVVVGRFKGGTVENGRQSIETLLASKQPFNVIVSINDAGAFGAIDALDQADISPSSVIIASIDAEARAQEYIRARHFMRGSLSVDRMQFSKSAIDALILLLAGKPIPELIIVQPGQMVTVESLK